MYFACGVTNWWTFEILFCAIMNNTAMNTVCTSLYKLNVFISLGQISRNRIDRLSGKSKFNLQEMPVFLNWSITLHSHQQYMRFLGALLPCHHLVLSFLKFLNIYLFGCIRSQLQHANSYLSMWDLVCWAGIKLKSPALETWSPIHWTTKEVPLLLFLIGVIPVGKRK